MLIINRKKLLTFFIVIFIFYSTLNILTLFIPIKRTLSIIILSLILTFLYPKTLTNRHILLSGLFLIVLIVNNFTGDSFITLDVIIKDFFSIFMSILIFTIYYEKHYFEELWIIIKSIFTVAIFTSLISIPTMISNPLIVRQLNKIDESGFSELANFRWIIDYGKVHAILFTFPLFVFIIKSSIQKRNIRILAILILIILFFTILLSSATASLFLSVFAISLALIVKTNLSFKKNLLRVLIITIPFLLLLNDTLIIFVLEYIQPLFSGSTTYKKIELIKIFIEYGSSEGGFADRNAYHSLSANTFIENFLFGTNSENKIGRHSFFLDRIASLGIIGILPFVLLLISYQKKIYRILTVTRIYYLIGCLSFIIMFFIKNVLTFEFWLYALFVLPGLSLSIEKMLNKQ